MIWRWTDSIFPNDPFQRNAIRHTQSNKLHDIIDSEPGLDVPDSATRQVRKADVARHVSNIIRCQLLYQYGGLWLDNDVIPFKDLCKQEKPWTATLRAHREGAAMWFPEPGHQALRIMLNVIRNHPESQSPSCDVSGSNLITRVMDGYPDIGKEERIFPLDAMGRPIRVEPIAIHLWDTASKE